MKPTGPILAFAIICFLSAGLPMAAQQPVINYTLTAQTDDWSSVDVSMSLLNLPKDFHLAMVRHFLVDDRCWRSVEGLQITSGTVAREQDGLWRVTGADTAATVHYKIRLTNPGVSGTVRKPFLTPTGGLFGDLHTFLYVVETPQVPARVVVEVPPDWSIATTLTPTSDPRVFFARNLMELSDSPILAGKLREWRFQVDQTPIRVACWPLPDAGAFDEKPMLNDLEKIVRSAATLFGGLPWREYLFQVRDGPRVEGFEHSDCVTLEFPNSFSRDPQVYATITHEFFHAWNMMRIHSAEYTGPDYKPVKLSGLWFSEGFTMFYADLIPRRVGLPTGEPTRVAHLESLISQYLEPFFDSRRSAEQASRAGLDSDVLLQGELIAAMLDLTIRDATEGRRSLDDLMRAMFAQFSGAQGFTTDDVQRLAGEICGRNLAPFFDANVRSAGRIDFDRYLRLAGLKLEVRRKTATNPDGTPAPDLRVGIGATNDKGSPQLFPEDSSAWSRAGLHPGDRLLKLNGSTIRTLPDFWRPLKALHVGDHVTLEVLQGETLRQLTVPMKSYEALDVKIHNVTNATDRQKETFAAWTAGQ